MQQNNYNNNNILNNNNNNRYNKHNNNNLGGGMMMSRGLGSGMDDMRNRIGGGNNNNNNHHMNNNEHNNNSYGMSSNNNNNNNNLMMNAKELAPRFKRNLMSTNENTVENLQMRPAPNSLLGKATQQNHKYPAALPILAPLAMTTTTTPSNNNNTNDQNSLSNVQYPMLSTPTANSTMQQQRNINSSGGSGGVQLDAAGKLNDKSISNGSQQQNQDDKYKTSQQQQQNSLTKTGSVEKSSAAVGGVVSGKQDKKKDKNINKEEFLQKVKTFIQDNLFYETKVAADEEPDKEEEEKAVDEIAGTETSDDGGVKEIEKSMQTLEIDIQLKQLVEKFLELKIPEKFMKDACINVIMDVMDRAASNEHYIERIVQLLLALRQQSNLKANVVVEIFKQVVHRMNDREALVPRITTHVAHMLAKAVDTVPPLLKLNDIASYTENGQHYPLMLLVLQQLHKSIGRDKLEEKFSASKIDLMQSLPEADRNKIRLSEILDDRNLAFLYPLLKLETEMMKQLKSEPDGNVFYKWIKTTVDAKYYKDPGFINALVTVLLKYIIHETTLAGENVDVKKLPEKAKIEAEKNMAAKYLPILQRFLIHHDLQLIALYALQVVCYNEKFPKGMLFRWFKYMYHADLVEDEIFFAWKEEVNDKYPGKGDALFQVNSWLTWLQEAESEDDE